MRLIEADAKQLLAEHGLPVPPGRLLLREADPIPAGSAKMAVKAQLLSGGRGKAGLVRLAGPDQIGAAAASIRAGMREGGRVPLLMIEQQVSIARELFLAWRIDDVRRMPVLMFSPYGGIEVEADAGAMREQSFDPLQPVRLTQVAAFLADCGLAGRALAAVARFALDLHHVLVSEDALLIEINPLVLTDKNAAIAVDAKMTLDENAARRHGEWRRLASHELQAETTDPIELDAAKAGITFVRLEGNVALVTGGAGVGMTLVDLLADAGLAAANFVDLPGGSDAQAFGDLTRLVLRRAQDPAVKAMVVFLTLSATSLKQPVESILDVLDAAPTALPLVVGIVAGGSAEREMTLAQAREAFGARGHHCVDDLDAAVAAVKRLMPA